MSDESHSVLPSSVLSAFLALLAIGLVLGVMFGAGALSGAALTWIVLGGVTVFVPWSVVKLDPRGLTEAAQGARKRRRSR